MRSSHFFTVLCLALLPGCPGRTPDDGGGTDSMDTITPDTTDVARDDGAAMDAGDEASPMDAADAVDAVEEDTGPVDAGPPTFERVQAIFTRSCALADTQCHNTNSANNLRLDVGFAYAQIVGVQSDEVPRLQRVHAGDSANSYLVLKLRSATLDAIPECPPGMFPPSCGSFMPAPPFSTPLSQSDVDLIRAWIDMGAMP